MNSLQTDKETKRLAQQAVTQAVREGRLVRQSCETHNCPHPTSGVVAHHDDYRYPLTVRWLCRSHHVSFHKQLERDARDLQSGTQNPQPVPSYFDLGGLLFGCDHNASLGNLAQGAREAFQGLSLLLQYA